MQIFSAAGTLDPLGCLFEIGRSLKGGFYKMDSILRCIQMYQSYYHQSHITLYKHIYYVIQWNFSIADMLYSKHVSIMNTRCGSAKIANVKCKNNKCE